MSSYTSASTVSVGVRQQHDESAGGLGVQLEHHQVRAVGAEHVDDLVDVARPRAAVGGGADASAPAFVHGAGQARRR